MTPVLLRTRTFSAENEPVVGAGEAGGNRSLLSLWRQEMLHRGRHGTDGSHVGLNKRSLDYATLTVTSQTGSVTYGPGGHGSIPNHRHRPGMRARSPDREAVGQ